MGGKFKWDWSGINEDLTKKGRLFTSITDLAEYLKIPRKTVTDAINKGFIDPKFATGEAPETADSFIFEEKGNTAWVKYKAAEPLDPQEAAEIGGIDLSKWEIVKQKVNFWQMGRKDKQVDLHWNDGRADGFVKDSGEIRKTYLYQVEIELTRIERIAVIPVISPVIIKNKFHLKKTEIEEIPDRTRILFITDPHFGFRVDPFEKPAAFHSRRFLSDLLAVAIGTQPDYVVWGGDILDLADFSTFPTEPAIVHKTQVAGIEAAWVINQFGLNTKKQVLIEGNHDVRLRKAMARNFKAAYELRPVHDLDGESLLSVPRFLGLDKETVEWIGDYPNGYFEIGSVRFEHGHLHRNHSGGTVHALLKERTITTFFGHIHRAEKASKRVDGISELVTMATPGCACRREYTPGATRFANWSNGAFLITLKDGVLKNADHIVHDHGVTYFRGSSYRGSNYIHQLKDELPNRFIQNL